MKYIVLEVVAFIVAINVVLVGAAIWRTRLIDQFRRDCPHPEDWEEIDVDASTMALFRSCGRCGEFKGMEPLGEMPLTPRF